MVVAAVLSGDRSMFLDTEELLHQWRVWDNVLSKADTMEPELYPKGFALDEVELSGVIGSISEENEDSPHIEL
jgi:glucose-6-phosphate 1-dehydrogenase